jgi:hypothetical protein
MRKLTFGLIVAILTFTVGVAIFVLCGSLQALEEIPAPQQRPAIPEGWKKVEAEGRFSFYLPPDMKSVELSCYLSDWEGFDILANQSLGLDYGYGARVSCDRLLSLSDKATLQTFSVEVGGRKATLSKWVDGTGSRMRLCIPDVGDGKTKLNLRVMYNDARGADMARQVFDTIELK